MVSDVRWRSVSFGGREIAGVVGVALDEGVQCDHPVGRPGENPEVFVWHAAHPGLSVTWDDPGGPGRPVGKAGVVEAALDGGVRAVIVNAVWPAVTGRSGLMRTTSRFEAAPLDGITSPISLTVDDLPMAPDAVLVPRPRSGRGRSVALQADRIRAVLEAAEPILLVDRRRGGRGYARMPVGGFYFVTPDPADTRYFGLESGKLAGAARYRWADGHKDGIRRGYLVDDAKTP